MSEIHIEQDALMEFVKNLPFCEGTIHDNVRKEFGVDELDLSLKNLSYISMKVFDCQCCNQIYSIEFAKTYNEDEVWCKWCVEEEPIEIEFSEGLITLEEYNQKMNKITI